MKADFATICSTASTFSRRSSSLAPQRKEDIPLLVEYFVDRYASKVGKKITAINKRSLESYLKSYPWPGNIRELQNVIERSVIVCDSQNLSVDETWLGRRDFLRLAIRYNRFPTDSLPKKRS